MRASQTRRVKRMGVGAVRWGRCRIKYGRECPHNSYYHRFSE